MVYSQRLGLIIKLFHHAPKLGKASRGKFHTSVCCRAKSMQTDLGRQLMARIKLNGPITTADYIKEVLTNPTAGYYMHKDVFGEHGDFITSPEISQMFGELIGVWCVNEWMQCGSPDKIQVVEFGPGRGTLSEDMLRVFSQFPGIKDAVSLHLVEVSPKLSEIQQQKLTGNLELPSADCSDEKYYKRCKSKYGSDVFWYNHIRSVPRGFSFYIAHEFFDALPINTLKKADGKWHEVLVDMDESEEGPHHFRFVLSRSATAASKILLQQAVLEDRNHVEICPEGGAVVDELSSRIAADGGFALIADYGHSGEKSDTLRAFRNHKQVDPLCEPGTADLTADVDFSYLKSVAGEKVTSYGPITQETFLNNMGIGLRAQALMATATTEQRKNLITGYDMLTNPDKMGERFKFLALLQHGRTKDYKPAGFIPP